MDEKMKEIAILNVDEEKLNETGHTFEEEMGRIKSSGIILEKYWDASERSEYEYAAFCWNTKKQQYERVQRPLITERLSRARYEETVRNGYIKDCYDTGKVIFKRRLVQELYADWEELEVEKNII